MGAACLSNMCEAELLKNSKDGIIILHTKVKENYCNNTNALVA